MIKKIIYLVLATSVGVFGYFGFDWYRLSHIDQAPGNQNASSTTISFETVESHSSENDCFMVINQKVYDVTNFIIIHPGGTVIKQGCGKESTALFKNIPKHAQASVDEMLTKLWVGNLPK